MRAPVILPIFGTALRAWWDDDAPRLGASLAYYTHSRRIIRAIAVATRRTGAIANSSAKRR